MSLLVANVMPPFCVRIHEVISQMTGSSPTVRWEMVTSQATRNHVFFEIYIFYILIDPPVECTSYNSRNESNRHWSYKDASVYCDHPGIISNEWYRFTRNAGTMMAPHCIPQYSCNSEMAGWINGSHPAAAYELESATACMHGSTSCCHQSYPVEIRECNGYYVYKLQQPAGCNERYCGVLGTLWLLSNYRQFTKITPPPR